MMRCLYCQKPVGPFRRLRDSEFCSDDHRRRMRKVSARVARSDDDYEPFWPVIDTGQQPRRHQSSAISTVVFGIVLATALIIGSSGVPFSGSGSSGGSRSSDSGGGPSLLSFLRREGAVRFRDDFGRGLTDWSGERNDGWSRANGLTRPGRLRVWAPTANLTDYQFDFAGQIEKRGMGWAFRAADVKNYYATKLVITQPGALPRAELVRYAVLAGNSGPKTRLPLPLLIRTDTVYQVRVKVRGNQFSTMVNGQMVDTWTDDRLKKGGVGLFTDAGESANIRYASLSNRDSLIGQMLSYFGFWLPPVY